jgi:hypothetical protein
MSLSHRKASQLVEVIVLSIFCGCSTLPSVTNRHEPTVARQVLAEYTPSFYHTFSLIRYIDLNPAERISGDEDRYLYDLMNAVIIRGYRYTLIRDSADIVFTILVKPHTFSDERLPTNYPKDAAAPAKGLPSVSEFKFGTQDSLPRSDRIERNSKGDGSSVSVWIFGYDGKTGRPLISIFGFGHYPTNSLSVAAHYVIRRAIDWLDYATDDDRLKHYGSGMAGFTYEMFSADGYNYWPTISSLVPDYPAEKAGLKVDDAVVKINDLPFKNASSNALLDIVKGEPGKPIKITFWRYNEGSKEVSLSLGKRLPE